MIWACLGDDNRWHPRVISVSGEYSVQTTLKGLNNVTGLPPSGNTTNLNFCKQVRDLERLGNAEEGDPTQWYIMSAIEAHEQGHVDHFWDDIKSIVPTFKSKIEALSIPDEQGMTREQAISKIRNLSAFFTNVRKPGLLGFSKQHLMTIIVRRKLLCWQKERPLILYGNLFVHMQKVIHGESVRRVLNKFFVEEIE